MCICICASLTILISLSSENTGQIISQWNSESGSKVKPVLIFVMFSDELLLSTYICRALLNVHHMSAMYMCNLSKCYLQNYLIIFDGFFLESTQIFALRYAQVRSYVPLDLCWRVNNSKIFS